MVRHEKLVTSFIFLLFFNVLLSIISPAISLNAPFFQDIYLERTDSLSDWPMFRHDQFHNGSSQFSAPDTNELRWLKNVGKIEASPSVSNGKVYIAAHIEPLYSMLYCIDAVEGTTIWSKQLSGAIISSPAIYHGFVYVGSNNHKLYCFDADTGLEQWVFTANGEIRSSPTVSNQSLYFGTTYGTIYCLNSISGQVIWSKQLSGMIKSSPAVAYGHVYITCSEGYIYSLNKENGDNLWMTRINQEDSSGYITSSPMIHDGKVYIGALDNRLYCLQAYTGQTLWKYLSGNHIYSSPAYYRGNVYFSSNDERIYCLNATTGLKKWSFDTNSGYFYSSPVLADGKLYSGTWDGDIYCLNADDGGKIWKYQTNEFCIGSPAIYDNKLYIGCFRQSSYGGSLFCIGEQNEEPVSSFTMSDFETYTYQEIFFNDTSYDPDGYISEWLWDFGDGHTGTKQNMTHYYSDDDIYTVCLTVTDNEGLTATAEEQIQIFNQAPIAINDTVTIFKNSIETIDVISNDFDIDGSLDTSSIQILSDPQHGDAIIDTLNGTIEYSSEFNYVGNDSLIYRVSDDDGSLSNSAKVRIQIRDSNGPIGNDDTYQTPEDTILSIAAPGILSNDINPNGSIEQLTVIGVTNPLHGELNLKTNGSFKYTPDDDYNGVDTWSYVAFDGIYSSNDTVVYITVLPVNDPPVASNDVVSTQKNTLVEINVIANDIDIDGSIVFSTLDIISNVTHGHLQIHTTEEIIEYDPTENYIGIDTFQYTIRDNTGALSNTATVTIHVVGDIPPTASFSFSPVDPVIGEDVTFKDTSTDVGGEIVNWSWDFNDSSKSFEQNPVHVFQENGSYAVMLTVTDDNGSTDSVVHTVIVSGINKAPVANFSYSPTDVIVEQSISFVDTSTDSDGYIKSWKWDFGDGTTSILRHPPHIYVEEGIFQVRLTVTDDDGVVNSKKVTITVQSADELLPLVTIVNPTHQTNVQGLVIISGTAYSKENSIKFVEVQINNGDWVKANGTTNWTYQWDTTRIQNGTYQIEARSNDGSRHSDIQLIRVIVNNDGYTGGSNDETSSDEGVKDNPFLSPFIMFSLIILFVIAMGLVMIVYVLRI
jgi:outer membrane protein assembly factor BamB